MRRFMIVAASVLAVLGVPVAGIALASPAHGSATAKHDPRMNISFMSGPGSSAHWTPRQQAVLLTVGADTGGAPEFAAIVVHHFPAAAPAQEPSFTVVGPGSPVLKITFAGGGFVEETAGGGSAAWTAFDSSGNPIVSGTDYQTALAAEQVGDSRPDVVEVELIDSQVTGGAAYTDTITALQYNGVTLVPRDHHHGKHGKH
jgi:hypothetical protein